MFYNEPIQIITFSNNKNDDKYPKFEFIEHNFLYDTTKSKLVFEYKYSNSINLLDLIYKTKENIHFLITYKIRKDKSFEALNYKMITMKEISNWKKHKKLMRKQ